MLSPARRHRLQALAARAAALAENAFGDVREDASVYLLQLAELKTTKICYVVLNLKLNVQNTKPN